MGDSQKLKSAEGQEKVELVTLKEEIVDLKNLNSVYKQSIGELNAELESSDDKMKQHEATIFELEQ